MRAGTLKSTSQQKIVVEAAPSGASGPVVVQEGGGPPQVIVIQPAQPNVVYVPAYNPTSVYGAPIAPPPGYSPGYSGGQMLAAGVIGFGAGFLTSSLINHGNNYWGTNWSHGQRGLQPQRIHLQYQLLRPWFPRLSARISGLSGQSAGLSRLPSESAGLSGLPSESTWISGLSGESAGLSRLRGADIRLTAQVIPLAILHALCLTRARLTLPLPIRT